MKIILILLQALMIVGYASGQKLIASNPAKLQVYFLGSDGKESVITSTDLSLVYQQLNITGELDISSFSCEDPEMEAILDRSTIRKITFSTIIPQEQFVFHNTLNNLFSTEAELFTGESRCRIMLNFDLSNQKTSSTNTFIIICTGTLSLSEDLGIINNAGIDDKVSFQFFQNVRSLN